MVYIYIYVFFENPNYVKIELKKVNLFLYIFIKYFS